MRRTVPIILLVLGIACAVIGVGRLTFWGPPETLTASTGSLDSKAPLTMITQPVGDLAGDGAELTVHADGDFRAMVGRAADVEAWAGDAATTVVSGVDQKDETFTVRQRPGASTSPDPAGSDLWVVDAEHQGDWTASWSSVESQDEDTWSPPADGDWTLLLATDGSDPAPSNLSLTWDNPDATWAAKFATAVWWFIGALVLLILALVLFTRKPRSKGRRAAVPAAPGSRRAARELEQQSRPGRRSDAPTDQVPVVAAEGLSPVRPPADDIPPADDDQTVIRPLDASEPADTDGDETMIRPLSEVHPDVDEADGPAVETDETPATDAAKEDDVDQQRPERAGTTDDDDFDLPGGVAEDDDRRGGPGRGARWRRGAAVGLTATALLLPAGSAWATPQVAVAPMADTSDESSGNDAHPVLVESQLQRIMKQVSAAQAKGDKSRKAADLQSRFSGPALEMRKSYYANHAKGVKDNSAVPQIAAEPVRASAVTTSSQWPRTLMVVTQGQNQSYPVVTTLQQSSPRANYSVVQAVPMVAEAKLPGVTLGSPEVVTQQADQDGLAATPADAVDGFADLLKNSKSKWAEKFEDSVFVDVWHQNVSTFTKALKKSDPKASFNTTFTVDSGATNVLASPQGGSYVSADVTITTAAKPSQGGTMTLPGDTGKLTGEKSTSKSVVSTYQVPIFLYIPANGDGKIRVIGASQQLSGIQLK